MFWAGKSVFAEAGSGKENGSGLKRAWHGLGFSAEASNQISLMKWEKKSNRSGRKKRTSVSFFSKIAIHGNFTLGFRPFHKVKLLIVCNSRKSQPMSGPFQAAAVFFPAPRLCKN